MKPATKGMTPGFICPPPDGLYVATIYKFYVAYQMITEQREESEKAKETVKQEESK